ncbi:MAG: hypothetical protein ACKVH1_15350 [Alphaproteobacteria bacterium]|jgi:hypothetical protein|tara:strand:+ start:1350 stop:1676 length:327 start_codon:yes stop_codon:yes gene_type:complete
MADEKIVYSVTLKLEKTFEIPVSVSKDELIDILVNNELDTDYLESDDFEEEKRESLFAKLCFALSDLSEEKTIDTFLNEMESFDMKVNHATPQHGPTFESLFNVNGER